MQTRNKLFLRFDLHENKKSIFFISKASSLALKQRLRTLLIFFLVGN